MVLLILVGLNVVVVLTLLAPIPVPASLDRPRIIAGTALALAALIWSLAVSIYLFFVPFYEGMVAEGTRSGTSLVMERRTLIEVNGAFAIAYLILPVVLTALPWSARRESMRRRLSLLGALLLWGFVLVGALSVGLFYVPSAVLSTCALVLRHGLVVLP